MDIEGKDPKTAVNEFCQRYCRTPITRQCIVYTSIRVDSGGFQATVKLNCIDGQEFAGEVGSTLKEAEQNAAMQVLEFYASEIATMAPVAKKGKKRKASDSVGASLGLTPGSDSAALAVGIQGEVDASLLEQVHVPSEVIEAAKANKSELNAMCSKIVRRVMDKGDVVYETYEAGGGFQATVALPGLPGTLGGQVWAGEVRSKKVDAEQSAAGFALEAIKADPDMMAAFNAPPKPKNYPSKGKGKSKGKFGKGTSNQGLFLGGIGTHSMGALGLGMGMGLGAY
mmetsp:Transcript_116265/g.328906  ORF Transcript_116265/g.328906 Transcript_116265/m.328906 type:complete len:283 (-) Transcript_116265:12-860(-)